MTEQTQLFSINNQNLFSNNYLEKRLPNISLWEDESKKAEEAFEKIIKAYDSIKTFNLGSGEEAELESRFIRPVLKALGFEYKPQPPLMRRSPDYALFEDEQSYKLARGTVHESKRFYAHALTILEAKYWERRLNDTDANDKKYRHDPTAQTVKYLDDVSFLSDSRIQWAILTNGAQWRLFYHKASSRSGNFYEVDLKDIILSKDSKRFLYFYLFFSRDAFVPHHETRKTWLDQHLEGSEQYAARISNKLKDLVFDRVFIALAEGFIHYRHNELGIHEETEQTLEKIFKDCLMLLYRLLFILYAESRELLPVGNKNYYRRSFSKLKHDIVKHRTESGLEGISTRDAEYWSRLKGLFKIISKGDVALNMPIYNGGLFEEPAASILVDHEIPNRFLAEAIDLLTIDREGDYATASYHFIDYSSLSVRHLGDIYEGLLEFHLRIAEEDLVEVRQKGKSIWQEASKVKASVKTFGKKEKGEVYIENSKRERRATGSYYTPHYIVEYIVDNTVGPMLDERLNEVRTLLEEYKKETKKAKRLRATASIREQNNSIRELEERIFNELFDIKVLDPAMGSGHFLVHTVDYITDKIVKFLAEEPENPIIKNIEKLKLEIIEDVSRQGVSIDVNKLTEVNLIKRMVMKRCVYGVDINEMAVELAKLSLWLDSFTLGAPLSFLDHHFKCGNSLLGSTLNELEKTLEGQLFALDLEPLRRATKNLIFVSKLSDSTHNQVLDSARKYHEAINSLQGYRILLDLVTTMNYGSDKARDVLTLRAGAVDVRNLAESIKKLPKSEREIIESVEKFADKYGAFNWEFEFPEVFFDEMGAIINNGGFDTVIGNPPYVRQEGFGEIKDYFKYRFSVYHGTADLYTYFIERGVSLLKKDGLFSYIVANKWMRANYGEPLRRWMKDKEIVRIIDFGDLPVFQGVTTYPCILIIKSGKATNKFKATNVKNLNVDGLQNYINENKFSVSIDSLDDKGWTLVDEASHSLLEKLKSVGIPLSDYVDGNIYRGVLTGLNEAFVIDEEIKDSLIKKDLKSAEFIKPFLAGKDIKRYKSPVAQKYLILFPKGFTKKQSGNEKDKWKWLQETYPALAKHLGSFALKGEKRGDKGEYWWELGACDYDEELDKPKITYPNIRKKPEYILDDTKKYSNQKYFISSFNAK